jgi:hypothetical protein
MLIMSVDDAAAPRPAPVRYSVWVTRAICRRVAAGETLVAICRDADMPARCTVGEWLRKTPKFAEMYARAKVFGDRTGGGGRPAIARRRRTRSWCGSRKASR